MNGPFMKGVGGFLAAALACSVIYFLFASIENHAYYRGYRCGKLDIGCYKAIAPEDPNR